MTSDQGAEALLPCPFCGSSARFAKIISPEGERRGDVPSYDVSCTECWCWTRHNTEAEVRADWNRRAPPQSGGDGWRTEVEAELRRRAADAEKAQKRAAAGDELGEMRWTARMLSFRESADLVRDYAPPAPTSDEGSRP